MTLEQLFHAVNTLVRELPPVYLFATVYVEDGEELSPVVEITHDEIEGDDEGYGPPSRAIIITVTDGVEEG
jgi:hypothetical protein